jgi:hypothetical protein
MELTLNQALAAQQAHSNHNAITAADIRAALAGVSTTFARLVTVTEVKTAARHRDVKIQKVTRANVQLFSSLRDATEVYARAVRRSAASIGGNDPQDVANFTAHAATYEHDAQCHSLVTRAGTQAQMLYARYLRSRSVYLIAGQLASPEQVAQYLTPSAARELLTPSDTVTNRTHGIQHRVRIATPRLENVVELLVRRQLILK